MKTFLECIPCFMNQAFRAGKTATEDENVIKRILNEAGCLIPNIPMEKTPAETGKEIYRIVTKNTGVNDPYKELKQKHIADAKSILPQLEEIVRQSDDKLLTAIRIAIAGNVIDLGIDRPIDLVSDVQKVLSQNFALFDYALFKKKLEHAETVLYLGDNAGETVFDTVLIKALKKPVSYAVRHKPIINDATMEDALASGVDKVAQLIDSGSESPGTILSECSEEFKKLFYSAGLIISKGQGNYEGLSHCRRDIFFLLKAKCTVIARHLKVNREDIVLKYHRGKEEAGVTAATMEISA